MWFVYLWEVVKRAFTPAPRVTDILQILAASTLPAITKFAGVELPANASEDALAYIGLIAVTFIVIRFLWAPYSIWKDQSSEVAQLRSEISKPQRVEMLRLAEHRADARASLAETLAAMNLACEAARNGNPAEKAKLHKLVKAIDGLSGRANCCRSSMLSARRD